MKLSSNKTILIFYLSVFCIFGSEASAPSDSLVLEYIQSQLPHCGVLKQNAEGFLYVDVDDAYIHTLITFLRDTGFQEPPYFGNANLVGAHISVMYADEVQQYGLQYIPECGELIEFIPKECQVVHPPTWHEVDQVYVVVVEAPELNQIREKYGLPKRKYAFHITIGVKYLTNSEYAEVPLFLLKPFFEPNQLNHV